MCYCRCSCWFYCTPSALYAKVEAAQPLAGCSIVVPTHALQVEPPGKGDALRSLRALDASGTSLWWRSHVRTTYDMGHGMTGCGGLSLSHTRTHPDAPTHSPTPLTHQMRCGVLSHAPTHSPTLLVKFSCTVATNAQYTDTASAAHPGHTLWMTLLPGCQRGVPHMKGKLVARFHFCHRCCCCCCCCCYLSSE